MGKGSDTHERILDHAVRMASRDGLDGLTVAGLAGELGLSKSGLFAHFGSKDSLQVQVLAAARERFLDIVLRPALKAPRGEPRVVALFERWLTWVEPPNLPGGCIFVAASVELDDRPGPPRDFLVSVQKDWFDALEKVARGAVEEGQLRADLDVQLFVYELYSIMLGFNHYQRLLRDPRAEELVRAAFQRLLASSRS